MGKVWCEWGLQQPNFSHHAQPSSRAPGIPSSTASSRLVSPQDPMAIVVLAATLAAMGMQEVKHCVEPELKPYLHVKRGRVARLPKPHGTACTAQQACLSESCQGSAVAGPLTIPAKGSGRRWSCVWERWAQSCSPSHLLQNGPGVGRGWPRPLALRRPGRGEWTSCTCSLQACMKSPLARLQPNPSPPPPCPHAAQARSSAFRRAPAPPPSMCTTPLPAKSISPLVLEK